jgi:hypothetical protein
VKDKPDHLLALQRAYEQRAEVYCNVRKRHAEAHQAVELAQTQLLWAEADLAEAEELARVARNAYAAEVCIQLQEPLPPVNPVVEDVHAMRDARRAELRDRFAKQPQPGISVDWRGQRVHVHATTIDEGEQEEVAS